MVRGGGPRKWLALAGFAAAALVLGVVLSIQTGSGAVKIELSDPKAQVEVKVNGDVIDIAGLKEPLRLKAGEHGLLVTSGDYQSVSESFTVRRGGEDVLRVTLEPKPKSEAPKPRAAVYAVVVNPPQGKVSVAGKGASIEGSDAARTITVAEPDGQATVSVVATLAGYETLVRELKPKPGESGRLALVSRLQRLRLRRWQRWFRLPTRSLLKFRPCPLRSPPATSRRKNLSTLTTA